jgi:hypothetical protein
VNLHAVGRMLSESRMTEMVPSGLMRECWKRSQGKAREAPATERAGEQIGLAYSHRASAPLYW